ncbi:MAG: chemotaxis protein CheA [Proteobacteria bacterium]|nr:chemotaxis protein CheA [Pseudomonadota bacterium]MBU1715254.1 chemotaxis protein CheA [Pseudomonadota bacterium]
MEYAEVFREEAVELLEELESGLLELEKDPKDLKLVGRVFRAMHTIKGSGAMFGFDDIANFTHHVETALDLVREGTVPVSKELIDLTLNSRDHISALLAAATGGEAADPERGREIIAALQAITSGASGKSGKSEIKKAPAAEEKTEGKLTHYRIHLQPEKVFFDDGGDVEQILGELRKFGECTVFIHQAADESAEDAESVWEILLTTKHDENSVRDVFIFAESSCKVVITPLAQEGKSDFLEHRKLGEILVARGEIDQDDLLKVLSAQKPLGEMLVDAHLVSRTKVEAALAEQNLVNKQIAVKSGKGVDSIRVASDKLDRLINLVGEMVVTQARLTDVSALLGDMPALVEPVEEVERLTTELRDCVLNIRMLPIGTTFSKFRRLVRDLSAELGKEVQMETEGAETELDKNVIDQLGDPLVHLIRNCLDHGIEKPEVRIAAGKPAQGTIKLAASHSGANVVIEVSDDGRGLDVAQIKQKGIEKGLIKVDEEISDLDILNIIFAPGLSTATEVTSVSGRGVGMDVVKNTIEDLKGSVHISKSVPGQGTTIMIMLPLTLAIIDGLLVKVSNTHFVLPLGQVEECVELSQDDIDHFHGRHVLSVRDQLVPYVRLRDFFEIGGERPELEQMVIVHNNGLRNGLVLDDVIGEHQTVLKSLGWAYRNAAGLSGATILGNGEVALIIDVPRVIKCAQQEEAALTEKVH